jgi:NDP-sugar pyrophosphorylase family protein
MARPRLRALVLSAGRGERLRPLTLEIPKPLLPVAGRPLAAWTLARLEAVGCEATAMNLHHLGGRIRDCFGERFGRMPLVYSEERELLGTGGALPPLAEFLGGAERILVVNGDSLCRWPLERLLERHRRSGAAATLLVQRAVDPRSFGGGVAVERGAIVAFRRGELAWESARAKRVFAGAAVIERELLSRLPAGPSDIVSALYEPMLAAGERIAALATARAWFDLGTPARYLAGTLAWSLTGKPARGGWIGAGAEVAPTARLRRTAVERRASVAAGADLVESLLLTGARVGADARLERVIVGPGVELPAAACERATLLTRSRDGALVRTPI